MYKKKAFIFPGQGAQYPGMGRDFYESYPVARQLFEEADELLGQPFSKLIFEGPASELTLTKNSQLAIYIVSLSMLRSLKQEFPDLQPSVCAGLSLGEYTALTASGILAFQDGLPLVKARAQFMHEASVRHPGSMLVVLGLEEKQVAEALSSVSQSWVANLNCPGQVVIAGTAEGLRVASEILKAKGARRVLPLEVSGAFHSGLMQEAGEELAPFIRSVPLERGNAQIVMNVPGDFVGEMEEMRKAMIAQVTQPVRWQKGVEAMHQSGVDFYLEIGPGKTLSGMNKRIGIEEKTLSFERVEDLKEIEGALHATT